MTAVATSILDCTSLATTLASLGSLLQLSDTTLRQRLADTRLEWSHPTVSPEDQLVRAFGYGSEVDLPAPSVIRWFHATRAALGSTYEEGLLPTTEALPRLWTTLGTITSKWQSAEEWTAFRESFERGEGQFASQFQLKSQLVGWDGPFAFLVRDAAVGNAGDHKDFTKLCETLEDICAEYEVRTGHLLRAAYQAVTRPCLVVFISPGDSRQHCVRAALNYAHRALHGERQGLDCNANYTGKGKAVPSACIERIEWLDSTRVKHLRS